jgi:MFS family permease
VPFYVAGVLASINAVAAVIRLPETRDAVTSASPATHRGIAGPLSPVLRRLAVVGFVTVVSFTAFEATFSLFGDRRFGLTEASSAAVFFGVGVVLVAIQGGAYGRLAERYGTEHLFATGLVLLVVGLATTAVATVWPVLIVALLLLAIGQGCASPSLTSLVAQHAPPVAGAAFDKAGIWSPYVGGAVLCAVAVALLVGWGLHREMPGLASSGLRELGIND